MSNKYSASLSAQTNFTIHRRVTATCKLEKYTIKKGNLSRHFQYRCYSQMNFISHDCLGNADTVEALT